MMKLEGNVGCCYIIRWEHGMDDKLSISLFWESNLDIPLEMLDQSDLEDELEYILTDHFKDKLTDLNWVYAEYENVGY